MEASDYKGGEIRRLRRARKWTQEDLARAASVTRMMIYLAEKGKFVSFEVLKAIAGALDVPIRDLLTDQAEQPEIEEKILSESVKTA